MKHMNCTFFRTEKTEIKTWRNIIGKLEFDLSLLCSENISYEDVSSYISTLCSNAQSSKRKREMAFFGMADRDTMPNDAAIDFFYVPTYYATAIIAKAVLLYPKLLDKQIKRLDTPYYERVHDVLAECLLGCTGRNFNGHGYENLQGMLDAMDIFTKADMGSFVTLYPEICPEFTRLYRQKLRIISQRIQGGSLSNCWGENYTRQGIDIIRKNGALQY